ncbi:beta-1 and beta-2 tubulin [Flagelloscypha sp. PMI_526]|nr:beta-1 and beta-2 tubulin [Flagelloscypha sp. PMI_526]
MREIISLQLGQAGNSIGCEFWESISAEHGLEHTGTYTGQNDLQLEHMDVYFNQLKSRKYVPRSLFVDLDPQTRNSVRRSPMGRTFRPDDIVVGQSTGGNVWAKGCYSDGAELADPVLEVVRREAEKSECLQGFQLIHSVGAATGGGMGSLLLNRLRDEYLHSMISSFTIAPGPNSQSALGPYNFLLSMVNLIETCDLSFLIDNQVLYDLVSRKFNITFPQCSDFNPVISQVMAGITSSFRFPSQNSLNSDLKRLCGNMVPFPRLHFLEIGSAPLIQRAAMPIVSSLPDLSQEIFDHQNSMSAYWSMKPDDHYLSLSILIRGNASFDEAQTHVHQARVASPYHRQASWLPDDTQVSQCGMTPNRLNMNATLLGNTTAVRGTFQYFRDSFSIMFKKKAFLHWYTDEGMDEQEFKEAEENVLDLILEYQEIVDNDRSQAEDEE